MTAWEREREASLVADNEGLAVRLAKRFGMFDPDGMQAARIGLLRALRRFDEDLGIRFSTYAAYWVRAELERERAQRPVVTINARALEERRRLEEVRERCGPASLEELADAASVSRLKTRAFEQLVNLCPRPLWGRGPGTLILEESLSGEGDCVEEVIGRREEWERILAGLARLELEHPRWALVVRRRAEGVIFADIAAELGLSPERVRQLEGQGRAWLRRDVARASRAVSCVRTGSGS